MKFCEVSFTPNNIVYFEKLFRNYKEDVKNKLSLLKDVVFKMVLSITYNSLNDSYFDIGYYIKKENFKNEYMKWFDIIDNANQHTLLINTYSLSSSEIKTLYNSLLEKIADMIKRLKTGKLNQEVEFSLKVESHIKIDVKLKDLSDFHLILYEYGNSSITDKLEFKIENNIIYVNNGDQKIIVEGTDDFYRKMIILYFLEKIESLIKNDAFLCELKEIILKIEEHLKNMFSHKIQIKDENNYNDKYEKAKSIVDKYLKPLYHYINYNRLYSELMRKTFPDSDIRKEKKFDNYLYRINIISMLDEPLKSLYYTFAEKEDEDEELLDNFINFVFENTKQLFKEFYSKAKFEVYLDFRNDDFQLIIDTAVLPEIEIDKEVLKKKLLNIIDLNNLYDKIIENPEKFFEGNYNAFIVDAILSCIKPHKDLQWLYEQLQSKISDLAVEYLNQIGLEVL